MMIKQFNEAQCQAIAHFTGPCLTLAGPGSGKTAVIVERIGRLLERGVPASQILVLTFTRAAAVEMRERFLKQNRDRRDANQVLFGTFHSAFFQILRYSGGYDAASVLRGDEKLAILDEVSQAVGIRHEREGWLMEVIKEISDVKGNGIEPEDFAPTSCTAQEFCVLYRGYQDVLQQRRKLDFDDMLLQCVRLFETRPEVLRDWQERCRFILVDEYQDSNKIQCRLAEMLAAPQNNIMVVGDDDQSIYGFRGAAPERMKDFLKTYPEAKQYLLNVNYRCPSEVVAKAGNLIRENQIRLPKQIIACETLAAPSEDQSLSGTLSEKNIQRKQGEKTEEVITCTEYNTLLEENEAVLARIQEYYQTGIPYEEMAVLYRINRNPAQLIRMMEKWGIPVQVRGSVNTIYHHWICQDFCAYLSVANGSTSRADWLRVISHPERYFSRSALGKEPVTLDHLFDFYSDDRRRMDTLDHFSYDLTLLRRAKPSDAIRHLRQYMGYDDYLEENDKSGESRLMEIAEQLQETMDGCENGLEWLEHVARSLENQKTGAERQGVQLMTMHGSKGLEFPVVFLMDANEGMTPYKRSDSQEEIEEERRLFYVAMTRSKKKLHISWTKERFHRPQTVSRFVREAGLWESETKKKTAWKKLFS